MRNLIRNFIISIATAFIVTWNDNYIYAILNHFGVYNEILKKSILSATIVFIAGILEILLSAICLLFAKIKIEVTVKQDKKVRKSILFTLDNSDSYEKQIMELEVKLTPEGRIANFIAKYLDINLEVFFNPKLLDVSLSDQWEGRSLNGYVIDNRSIKVYILKNMDVRGEKFISREYKMVEKILISPISDMDFETVLDYTPVCGKGKLPTRLLAKWLVEVKCEQFKVICHGGAGKIEE